MVIVKSKGLPQVLCGAEMDNEDTCEGDTFSIFKAPSGRFIMRCEECLEQHEIHDVLNAKEIK